MGIIPKVLLLFLIGIIAFIGFKWYFGDFTNIVETQITVIESPSILKEVKAIGEIIDKTMPLHVSNVALLDKDKPTRVGYKIEGDKKIRISRKSGSAI